MGHESTNGQDALLFLPSVLTSPSLFSLWSCNMHSEHTVSRNSHSGSPQQLGPLGHSLCFLLILEFHMEADIPAWGISFKEVLISPHAEWKQRIEREKKVPWRGGRAGEHGNQGKLFVGLGVFRLVFLSF